MIKLRTLNVGDMFYWKNTKYKILMTVKCKKARLTSKVMVYSLPYPWGPREFFPPNRMVKPLIRVKNDER